MQKSTTEPREASKPFCPNTACCARGQMRTSTEVIVIVGTLLASGCRLQAIVHASGLDEGPVADWQKRAGKPCQQMPHALVEQGKVARSQVQADAHWGTRAQTDCLDGHGERCHEPLRDGRSRKPSSGSRSGQIVSCNRFVPVVKRGVLCLSVATDGPRTPRASCGHLQTK
jgi:hypothetical protein